MTGAGAVHVLPVPTPFAVGRVNCYLVEDDPLTLVDAGPNSATSLTVLEAALGEHGRRIEDLERIVITHQHIDHIGLVQILADRSGAEVCALEALAPWLARYSEVMEADDAFAEALAPFRGRGALTPAMLERAGRRLSLVALELREPAGLVDLDAPQTLAAEGLRPSYVATRVRQRTQSDALDRKSHV